MPRTEKLAGDMVFGLRLLGLGVCFWLSCRRNQKPKDQRPRSDSVRLTNCRAPV